MPKSDIDTSLFRRITLDTQHFNFPDVIAVEKDTLRGWIITPTNDAKLMQVTDDDKPELWSIAVTQAAPIFSVGWVENGELYLPITADMLVQGYVSQTVKLKRSKGDIRFATFRLMVSESVDNTGATGGEAKGIWEELKDKLDDGIAKVEHYRNETLISAQSAEQAKAESKECQRIACECASNAAEIAKNVGGFVDTAKVKAEEAEASAKLAKTSETNAKTSEDSAKTSETNAKTSEDSAKASETNAGTAAETASTKASEAETSANNASTSETNAKKSETNASGSAATAQTNAETATKQASDAATSASNAESSASAALSSASAAKGFADSAKAFAEGASASATSASESAAAAEASESNVAVIANNLQTVVNEAIDATEEARNASKAVQPDATKTSKGIVQIGEGLSVTEGVVSAEIPDVSGLADEEHTHEIADVNGLEKALEEAGNVKSVNGREGEVEVRELPEGGEAGQVLKRTAEGYEWQNDIDLTLYIKEDELKAIPEARVKEILEGAV